MARGKKAGWVGGIKVATKAQPRAKAADKKSLKPKAIGFFLKGNDFWSKKTSFGPKPMFADAAALWKGCTEYFQACADNPLYEARLVSHGLESQLVQVPKLRAMTVTGLCIFLDINMATTPPAVPAVSNARARLR